MNRQKIKEVMSSVFEIPIENIDENSSIDNIEEWDSIKHLNLILALEDEFDVMIPNEEVGNMVNFQLVEIIINECTKK